MLHRLSKVWDDVTLAEADEEGSRDLVQYWRATSNSRDRTAVELPNRARLKVAHRHVHRMPSAEGCEPQYRITIRACSFLLSFEMLEAADHLPSVRSLFTPIGEFHSDERISHRWRAVSRPACQNNEFHSLLTPTSSPQRYSSSSQSRLSRPSQPLHQSKLSCSAEASWLLAAWATLEASWSALATPHHASTVHDSLPNSRHR